MRGTKRLLNEHLEEMAEDECVFNNWTEDFWYLWYIWYGKLNNNFEIIIYS